jgi:hypothetical protein
VRKNEGGWKKNPRVLYSSLPAIKKKRGREAVFQFLTGEGRGGGEGGGENKPDWRLFLFTVLYRMQWPALLCLLCVSLGQAKLYLVETSGKAIKPVSQADETAKPAVKPAGKTAGKGKGKAASGKAAAKGK